MPSLREMVSPRGVGPNGEPMSAKDKRAREQQLQELMVEFRSAAAEGVRVELVDVDTMLFCQAVFKVDLTLGSMTVQPAFLPESSWDLRDIGGIMRGTEFSRNLPDLAHLSSRCLGIELNSEMQIRIFHFADQTMRDDFYACLKILRMCAETVGSGTGA